MNDTSPPVVADGSASMSIRYCVTRMDLLCWQVHSLRSHRITLGMMIGMPAFLSFLAVRGAEFPTSSLLARFFAWVFITALLLAMMFGVTFVLTALTILTRQHRGLVGEHVLAIREGGLFEQTQYNESLHCWAGFHKVTTTRRLLLIYVTDALVHVVPMRAFSSIEQANAFQAELRKHIEGARLRPAR